MEYGTASEDFSSESLKNGSPLSDFSTNKKEQQGNFPRLLSWREHKTIGPKHKQESTAAKIFLNPR